MQVSDEEYALTQRSHVHAALSLMGRGMDAPLTINDTSLALQSVAARKVAAMTCSRVVAWLQLAAIAAAVSACTYPDPQPANRGFARVRAGRRLEGGLTDPQQAAG